MSTSKASKRFKLQVNIINVDEELLVQNWSVKPIKRFLLLTEGTASLMNVRHKIENMFAKLYPGTSLATVTRLRDSSLCELDDDFKVSEVFDDSNVVYAVLSNNPLNQKKESITPAPNEVSLPNEQQKKRKQTQNETNTMKSSVEQSVSSNSNNAVISNNTTETKQTPEPQPKKKKAKKKNQKNLPATENIPMSVQMPQAASEPEAPKAVQNKNDTKTFGGSPQIIKGVDTKDKPDQPAKEVTKTQKNTQATNKKSIEKVGSQNNKQPQSRVTPTKGATLSTPVVAQTSTPGVNQSKKQLKQEAQKKNAAVSTDKSLEPSKDLHKVEPQVKGKKAKNTPPQVSSAAKVDELKKLENQKLNTTDDKKVMQSNNGTDQTVKESAIQPNETPVENKKRKLAVTENQPSKDNDIDVSNHNGKQTQPLQSNKKGLTQVVDQPSQPEVKPVISDKTKMETSNATSEPMNTQKKAKVQTSIPLKEPAKAVVASAPTATKAKQEEKTKVKNSQSKAASPEKNVSSNQGQKEEINKQSEIQPVISTKANTTLKGQMQVKKENSMNIPETPTPMHSDSHIGKKSTNNFGIQMRDTMAVEAGRMMGRLLLGADDEEDEDERNVAEPQQTHIPPIIMSSKKSPALKRVSSVTSPMVSQNTPSCKEQTKQMSMDMISTPPAKSTDDKPVLEQSVSNSDSDSDTSSSGDDSSDDDSASKPAPNVATPNTNVSKASQLYTPFQKPTFSSLRQIAASAKISNLAAKASAIAGGVTPSISKHHSEPMDTSSSEEDNAGDSDSSSSDDSDSDSDSDAGEKSGTKSPQLNVRLAGQKSKGRNKRKSALFQLARDA